MVPKSPRLRSRRASSLACAFLGVATLVGAVASTSVAAIPSKTCMKATYKGHSWQVSVSGSATCDQAATWLPKFYSAPSRTGGAWTGPAGFICQKVARDPGYVQRGICISKSHAMMAWKRIG